MPDEPQISKADAVRRAIAEGIEKPVCGAYWIKEELKLDVTPQFFSVVKSLSLRLAKREKEKRRVEFVEAARREGEREAIELFCRTARRIAREANQGEAKDKTLN